MDIDLRPTEVNIKFLRNTTIALTFYYLSSEGEVVSLADYTGELVVMNPDTGLKETSWCVTRLAIHVGDTQFNKQTVVSAQGVYLEIPPEVTTTARSTLRYECLLVSSTGFRIPLAYGSLLPFE